MKKVFFLVSMASFIFFIFFPISAYSSSIKVEILKSMNFEIKSFYNSTVNKVEFNLEPYNTGTIPYKVRNRIDIFKDDLNIFTAWDREFILIPGDRKSSKIYWYINDTGNFTVRIRSYYGNEILEKNFSLLKNTSYPSENIFEIENFRTYDNFLVFDIKSKKYAEEVIIIPSEFPPGWIFEQEKLDFMTENRKKTVVINYIPSVWMENSIKLQIISNNGIFYTEHIFNLKKETGIKKIFHYLIDKIKLSVN